MADSSAVPVSSTPRSRVVRSLARAAERPCSRPGCPAPARATLTFSYATAEAFLDRLSDHADPQRYDLCARHATRTEPPRGWALEDRRPDDDRVEFEPPIAVARDLGSDATVAVLAAALRAVPDVTLPPLTSPVPPPEVEVPELEGAAGSPAGVESAAVRAEQPAAASPAVPTPVVPAPEATATPERPPVRSPRPVPAAGGRGPATDW